MEQHPGFTEAEVKRAKLIGKALEGRRTQAEAAAALGLSDRQVRRLVRRVREEGDAGLVSRRRGRQAPNQMPAEVREKALALTLEKYADYGPTLLAETLGEVHDIWLSRETLRRWLVQDGLRPVRRRHCARVHPPRSARERIGELVQADGSLHDWFEGRGQRCCLIVFIDDATSRLCALRFVEAETTQAYMETFADYLAQHGRPAALYTDRHSIFTSQQGEDRGRQPTRFARALATLDVELVTASSPQALSRCSTRARRCSSGAWRAASRRHRSPTRRRSAPRWTRPWRRRPGGRDTSPRRIIRGAGRSGPRYGRGVIRV